MGEFFGFFIAIWILFAIAVMCLAIAVMLSALYNYFWGRFQWLVQMKTWSGEPEYMEWPDVVTRLECGEGTLLQYQGRRFWAMHWHSRRLLECEAIEERVDDSDCFFTAQPLGYESMFVLRRRFPKVPIYCIRVDYRGSFS